MARYIRTQDNHHKKMDYKSELIALLKKHGVPYDPKYVFDQGLCRAYGAHNPMNILPTALPWANLQVRLRRVELFRKCEYVLIPKESDFVISSQNKIVLS